MMTEHTKRKATNTHRYTSLDSPNDREKLSWGSISGDAVRAAVTAITDAGDAILLGRTSDGGALSLRVLSGGNSYASYYPTLETAEMALLSLTAEAAKLAR